jgi:hypothetical protein
MKDVAREKCLAETNVEARSSMRPASNDENIKTLERSERARSLSRLIGLPIHQVAHRTKKHRSSHSGSSYAAWGTSCGCRINVEPDRRPSQRHLCSRKASSAVGFRSATFAKAGKTCRPGSSGFVLLSEHLRDRNLRSTIFPRRANRSSCKIKCGQRTADWLLDRRLRLPPLMPVGRKF